MELIIPRGIIDIMISFFLILLSLVAILFSFFVEVQIFYNLKRFGFPNDLTAQKILNFFTLGAFVLVGFNLALLILNLI